MGCKASTDQKRRKQKKSLLAAKLLHENDGIISCPCSSMVLDLIPKLRKNRQQGADEENEEITEEENEEITEEESEEITEDENEEITDECLYEEGENSDEDEIDFDEGNDCGCGEPTSEVDAEWDPVVRDVAKYIHSISNLRIRWNCIKTLISGILDLESNWSTSRDSSAGRFSSRNSDTIPIIRSDKRVSVCCTPFKTRLERALTTGSCSNAERNSFKTPISRVLNVDYISHAFRNSSSSTSSSKNPITSGEYREDKRVSVYYTPFKTRLERALKLEPTGSCSNTELTTSSKIM